MSSDIKKINRRSLDAFHEFGGKIKHAARWHIWLPEVLFLKNERGRFLKYFTLPGKWAYDIFFFEQKEIIEKRHRGFPDVRFCDNNVESYTTAKRLLGNTIGIQRNFEDLVLKDEKVFWDGFPYDLYNLDFCGTCFPDSQPPFSDTFKAIDKIIEKHMEVDYFPFTILLTMKAEKAETKQEAEEELIENIETNRRAADFEQTINAVIPDTNQFVNSNFVDFILISIPKLICHLAKDHCDVEVRKRAKYSRNTKGHLYYVAKFVFKFIARRQRSLRIMTDNYMNNVRQIMQLGNIITINNSLITNEIKKSLDDLKVLLQQRHDRPG